MRMTQEQRDRLRELEELEQDGVPLTAGDYFELRALLQIENDDFVLANL